MSQVTKRVSFEHRKPFSLLSDEDAEGGNDEGEFPTLGSPEESQGKKKMPRVPKGRWVKPKRGDDEQWVQAVEKGEVLAGRSRRKWYWDFR